MMPPPSLSLGSPRLSRETSKGDGYLFLDLSDLPPESPPESPLILPSQIQDITLELFDTDSDFSDDMELNVKGRPKTSIGRRENSVRGELDKKDNFLMRMNFSEKGDRRPRTSFRRNPPHSASKRSPRNTRNRSVESEKTDQAEPNEEDKQAVKNVSRLFGSKQPKVEKEKPEPARKNDSPWGEFEHHIRNIDLDTMHFQTKPFTNTSSGPFQSVMSEMQNEVKERNKRKLNLKNSLRMSIKFQGFKKNMAELKEAVQKQEEVESKRRAKAAKKGPVGPKSRGWKILRNWLQEAHLEKQKNRNMGGWNFLTKTMKNLTDQEKARQDLYEKYIYKPNAWTEGFSTLPQILQDRMKARADNPNLTLPRGRERPHTAVGTMRTRRYSTANHISIDNHKLASSYSYIGEKQTAKNRKFSRRPFSSVGY